MPEAQNKDPNQEQTTSVPNLVTPPKITLPKGGGAICDIGEKFAANPVTGTGSMTVPIAASPGRSGFGPQLTLSYDSGSGNGPFGFGWSLSLPAITRKTDKVLPLYRDAEESDVFLISGAEDLVPVFKQDPDGNWVRPEHGCFAFDKTERDGYLIRRYRPRIEGLFARIEQWTSLQTGEIHWRTISRDNVTTLYGKDNTSRIFDPADPGGDHPARIFSWLICASYDSKGNALIYDYVQENSTGVDLSLANEHNRTDASRSAQRYLRCVRYGNLTPNRDPSTGQAFDPASLPASGWLFEVVFDYGGGGYQEDSPDAEKRTFAQASLDSTPGQWLVRQDPFSAYRAGFEVRTCRLCRRVLMFHHFPDELKVNDFLVRSTEFTYQESAVASYITAITQAGFVLQPNVAHPLQAGSGQVNRYFKKSLPPLEFEYSQVPTSDQLARQPIQVMDRESLENLPAGLAGGCQWVDLDGEGSPGILTEQADGWYYKRNLSANNLAPNASAAKVSARLGPAVLIAEKPAGGLAGGASFMDLAGDGQVDLVQMQAPEPGFYERTEDLTWEPLHPFTSWPNINYGDPNLRFVDLTGDGHTDILITEGEALTWHESLAEDGFGPAVRVPLPTCDEEKSPWLVFADGEQSIYLADFSGDGLSDLARIRNGEICYWPNLGYGHFGAKVTMDVSPWFDAPGCFDPSRLRLADTDGSGTTDILYLGSAGACLYFNQSGNSWSDPVLLPQFPSVDNLASVQVQDLLGNGTACLVWSSPLPGDVPRPVQYLSLMDEKSHLLMGARNNLGAETRVHYAPSTRFYLDDQLAGKPWITRLPFPVHVVESVETWDQVGRNHFVTRYAYHHGYFDGQEREFRGFGMVEQWDTDEYGKVDQAGANVDAAWYAPPVYTRTWYHTGAYFRGEEISRHLASEYFGAPQDPAAFDAWVKENLLDDTILPDEALSADEIAEACRSLKGAMLRQEIYGADGTAAAGVPYSVTEQNLTIQCLQPRSSNRHAVFFTHAREAINLHYERNPADPRVGHVINLDVDDYGNVRKSISIAYGRQPGKSPLHSPDKEKQEQLLFSYTENGFSNPVDDSVRDTYGAVKYPDDYHRPLPCEAHTYEITGIPVPPRATRFTFEDFTRDQFAPLLALPEIPYEQRAGDGSPQKRLIDCVRTLYRDDDLSSLLKLGELKPLALAGESYKLAFTPGLVDQIFVRNGQPLLPDPAAVFAGQGGYASSQTLRGAGLFPENKASPRWSKGDEDGNWWAPTGRIFLSPSISNAAGEELSYARAHFFLPNCYCDPFGQTTTVAYDAYDLLMLEVRDDLDNRITAGERRIDGSLDPNISGNNYRTLQPWLVMDPNRNRTQAAFDALGLVVGVAVMGKPEEEIGDNLTGFEVDLSQDQIDAFHTSEDPHLLAEGLLKGAASRIIYDLHRFHFTSRASPDDPTQWEPSYTATLRRETHASELPPGQSPKILANFSYSDGFGREIQKMIQAEPGEVEVEDGEGNITIVNTAPRLRWLGSEWTIYNNKGQPVRKYEPFFSAHHHFQFGRKVGVSSILFYDPAGRVVATLHPDHTYEKVIFDPWQQVTWDLNDTLQPPLHVGDLPFDPKEDPDVGAFFRRLPPEEYLPTWYDVRTDSARALQRWPDQDVKGNPIPDNARRRAEEKSAADRAAAHAGTPSVTHFDSLGRAFKTTADNGKGPDGRPKLYHTRFLLDIKGNQIQVFDAKDREVIAYEYNLLSSRIHQSSMEAGERWMLNDVISKPILSWNSRGYTFQTEYDLLHRPIRSIVIGADANDLTRRIQIERILYGEQHPQACQHNLRGKVFQHLDQAGIETNPEYDFKGNLLSSVHHLAKDYHQATDWKDADALIPADGCRAVDLNALEAAISPRAEGETFTSASRFDALNRPIQVILPYSDLPQTKRINVIRAGYNAANLLEKMDVWLERDPNLPLDLLIDPAAMPPSRAGITQIDYNAKGQRERIDYANGASTEYGYDPDTFRLVQVRTTRPAGKNGLSSQLFKAPAEVVQDVSYTYDPVGNITHTCDGALLTIVHDGQTIAPEAEYLYDAIYRLVSASGREQIGQAGLEFSPPGRNYRDYPFMGVTASLNDPQALRGYKELYEYDAAGNITWIRHQAASGSWTKDYHYEAPSLLEPGAQMSNRLTSTQVGNGAKFTETYGYQDLHHQDVHGCITSINTMQLAWNCKDKLQEVDLGGGGTAFYVYDSTGRRVRKVIHNKNGKKTKDHIYLAGFEIHRQYSGAGDSTPELERQTLHILDGQQRIALVETRTQGIDPAPRQLIRCQLSNHLGSANLEMDDEAQLISYEEYSPYGCAAFQAVRSQAETPKRYRFSGKERDEESGFYDFGARYYLPWLGRWLSCDPIELQDGLNLYCYARNNPCRFADISGMQSGEAQSAAPNRPVPKCPVNYCPRWLQVTPLDEPFYAEKPTVDRMTTEGSAPYKKVMLAKGSIEMAKRVTVYTGLALAAEFIPIEGGFAFLVSKAPRVAAGIGLAGSALGGFGAGASGYEAATGRDITYNRLSEEDTMVAGVDFLVAIQGPVTLVSTEAAMVLPALKQPRNFFFAIGAWRKGGMLPADASVMRNYAVENKVDIIFKTTNPNASVWDVLDIFPPKPESWGMKNSPPIKTNFLGVASDPVGVPSVIRTDHDLIAIASNVALVSDEQVKALIPSMNEALGRGVIQHPTAMTYKNARMLSMENAAAFVFTAKGEGKLIPAGALRAYIESAGWKWPFQ